MDDPNSSRDDGGLFTLLYVSELATGGAAEVAGICQESRNNNARDRVTGILVFDGQAFCQFVEGPERAVSDLLDRLERDARHDGMHVLQFGQSPWPRRFTSWRLGYAFSADPAAIARIARSSGGDALAAFHDWDAVAAASDSPAR